MPRLFRWNASRIADSANGKWLSIGTTQPAACNNELPHQSTRTKSINSKWNTNKAQQSNREQNKKIEHIMSGERLGYKPIRLTWDYTGKWGTIWYRTSIWFVCVCVGRTRHKSTHRAQRRKSKLLFYWLDFLMQYECTRTIDFQFVRLRNNSVNRIDCFLAWASRVCAVSNRIFIDERSACVLCVNEEFSCF